ncbi:MAG: DinB family protein, partial [Chitinophagaceae bacterium]
MKLIFTAVYACLLATFTYAQTWTENDRAYILQDLKKTRDLLTSETKNLAPAQWDFKESPDRWSIRQIVEHINTWELLMTHEISRALSAGPQPALSAGVQPDSIYAGFILEEKAHITTDYTKPFTYSVPMGLIEGKTSMAIFLKMREESIQFIATTKADLR